MLESDSQSVRELFWNKQVIPKAAATLTDEDAKEDGAGVDDSRNGAAVAEDEATEDLQETEPLAVILVNSIFHLLFLPGISLSISLYLNNDWKPNIHVCTRLHN
jgi:hypothetical protein